MTFRLLISLFKKGFVCLIDLECWIQGNCQGILIDEVTAADSNACLDFCMANDECLWFTYNPDNQECVLLEDCQEVDLDCTNCLSGQRQCSAQKDGKLELFYVFIW